ncbi:MULTISPECIES: hypothetical protein [Actinoalloteichus]|uniref:Uncharacterized protein n=1 Tax=Actinoalloteichus fjordicus TaxID=1612552 RepID=A0AAC9PSA4_9PSEU|nr:MULTISPECIES: hypothetical protein [Actinoalloteichus]APU14797.1 hypothetical protein UA74_13695 [Actinoalloteichus fjordicus]APU20768.1 hypothetical protein UA75_13790 [Actinoalloteichus sp. GBA129-24]
MPEEDLRADFARLAQQEPPPTGLHADKIIRLARRRRRVRRTVGMLISGGLTAAVIILAAVVLPGGPDDAPPAIPAGPTPSSRDSAPSVHPEVEVVPDDERAGEAPPEPDEPASPTMPPPPEEPVLPASPPPPEQRNSPSHESDLTAGMDPPDVDGQPGVAEPDMRGPDLPPEEEAGLAPPAPQNSG